MDRIDHPTQNVKYVAGIKRISIELLFSLHYIQPDKIYDKNIVKKEINER